MPSPAVSRLAGSLQSEDMESPSQAKADSLRSVPDAVPLRLNPKTEDALRENGPQGSQSVSISASKPNAKSEAEGGDVHKQIEPEPAMRTVRMLKTGAKRKLAVRDDDEGDRKPASHQTADTPNPVRTQSHAATPLRDQAAGRPLREIASLRRESRARSTPTPSVVEGTRRPLATKSTNDDMASPQKASRTAKLTPVDDIAAAKSLVLKTMRSTDRLDAKKREKTALDKTTVEKTTIEKSTLGKTNLEKTTAETTTRGSSLSEPSAPRQQRQDNQTSSTPPQRKGRGRTEPAAVPSPPSSPVVADVAEPTDHGKRRTSPDTQPPPSVRATTTATGDEETEGSRPSRRARLAVSYAEPNLRVKMRRPTEALFDAVTGEGKTFVRRQSSLSLSDAQQVSGSAPTSTQQVQVHHGRSKSTGDCLGDGGRVTEKEKDKNKDKNGDKDDKDRDKNRDKDDKDRDKDKDKDRERPGSSATTTAAELGLATQRRQQTKTLPDDDQASSKSEVAVEKPRARSSAAASKTADGGRRAYVASSSSSRARSLAVVKDDGITEPSDIDVTDSDVVDPYEFIASPPRSSQPPEQQHITVRPSKSARRLSSITAADILPADDDDASAAGQTTMRGVAGRKRASMNLPSSSSLSSRRSMMDLSDDSYEGGDVGELSSRITTRRKSTLL